MYRSAINIEFGSVDNLERSYPLKKAENFSFSVNQVWGKGLLSPDAYADMKPRNGRYRRPDRVWGKQ
jgi:hypothetical protein